MNTTKSATVSEEFLNECMQLARQSSHLKIRIRKKLEPIMIDEDLDGDSECVLPNYPHYYALLFGELKTIKNNLDVINQYIDRTCFPDGDTVNTESVPPVLKNKKASY